MKAIVTGAGGQLGIELVKTCPADISVAALSHNQCDITDQAAVTRAVDSHSADVLINAAAYTAVDRAEDEPERAHRVNAIGARNVAQACESAGARLIHVSTDYVFDGVAYTPYTPNSRTNPINVYGQSKLRGEEEIQASGADYLIVRSGWLYAAHSHNFLLTILSALRRDRPLRVVNDQVGVPTASSSLAHAIWACAKHEELKGIEHWVDAGTATWFDFAVAIERIAVQRSIISRSQPVTPLTSAEFGAKARRPPYSVLDAAPLWKILGRPHQWEQSVAEVISEIA